MRASLKSAGAVALLASLIASSPLGAATGAVFEDLNGNGVRDPGEPGIPGVEVSNGEDVVLTDASGSYRVADRPKGFVFVIKPRGWSSPAGAGGLPRFYAPGGGTADFPLRRTGEPDRLRAMVLTDPQPSSPAEVDYLSRGLFERLGKTSDLQFGVTLGDVVYDRQDLFGAVNAVVGRAGISWHALPGNHDLSLGTPDEASAVAAFEREYGPSTYAFHVGPALFIALDDVRPLGGPRYTGGLTPEQFAFIGSVLRGSADSEWVVVMLHIPLFPPDPSGVEAFRPADRVRLFGLLKARSRVLVLSGHTHYQRHVFHGRDDGWEGRTPLHEYNAAAASGGFWGGPRDADGIPASTMWDGTPPGYAVLGLDGDAATMDYFPARLPAGDQLSLHAPRAVAPRQGYVSFYANVFNGHDGWTVEARVDDRAWGPMRRILGWDPTYAEAFLAQDAAARPAAGPRLPDPVVCYHLWRGMLPADLPVGGHVLQVRATDPSGAPHVAETAFQVAQP